jgi:hypothetical protein
MTDQTISEPYPGITDPAQIAKMDSCVQQVMDTGKDKSSAVAICMVSVTEGKPVDECILAFDEKLLQSTAPAVAPVAEAATIKARVRAAIRALDELLTEREIPESVISGVKSLRETFRKTWADLANETAGTREAESQSQASSNISEHFAESWGGIATIEEASTDTNPARQPLTMRVQLIRPGWGNSKDNHYYPAETLKRDAHVFEGVKMYTTNHDPKEKSVRTEVSQIKKIVDFTPEGAPVAEVNVFDPDFAEQVRNRAKSGALDSLECSVLGEGTSKPFTMDGRSGKLIESITNAESVDWVTRAGAGGKALEIAESEPQTTIEGATMADQTKVEVKVQTPVAETVAPVAEAVTTPAPAEPTKLSEVEVTALLEAEKRLPAASRVRLAEGQYKDGEEVKSTITKELAYLKDLLGSGQPFALGAPKQPEKSYTDRLAEAEAGLDKVNQKYFHGGK